MKSWKLLSLGVIWLMSMHVGIAQNDRQIDSLWTEYEQKKDIDKINILGAIYNRVLPRDRKEGERILKEAEALNRRINTDKSEAKLDIMYARYYQVKGAFDSMALHARKGLLLSRKISNDSMLSSFYNYMGMYHEKSGILDSSVIYYKQALDIGIIPKFIVYNNLGNVQFSRGDLEQSAYYLASAIKEARKINDISSEAIISNNLGKIYKQLGDTSRAKKYLFSSIQLKDSLGDERGKLFAMVTIAELLALEERIRLENEALTIAQETNSDYFINYFTLIKANRLLAEDNCIEVIKLLEPLYNKTPIANDQLTAAIHRKLASMYQCNENTDLAEKVASELLIYLNNSGAIEGLQMTRGILLNVYQDKEDYVAYFNLAPQYYNLKDSIQQATKLGELARLEGELEDLEQEQEIEQLNVTLKERQAKRNWIIAVSILVAFILSLLIYLRSRQIAHQKRIIEKEQQVSSELSRVNDELKQIDQIKSRFFTNISHELRTPLTLISAPIQLLLSKQESGSSSNRELQLVAKNTHKLQHLVEELLELSRIEAGKSELVLEAVSLNSFCRQLFSSFESSASMKQIDYQFQTTLSEKMTALLDKNRVTKIINNLISNALKFTGDGGKVEMTINSRPFPTTNSQQSSQGNTIPFDNYRSDINVQYRGALEIKIFDTGRGISLEDLPYVFDRYFQTKNKNLPTEGGTGVGLALAKELAELHKGSLSVESEWEKGTIFTLTLPLVEADRIEAVVEENKSSKTWASPVSPIAETTAGVVDENLKKILIVEDNTDMQQLLQQILAENYQLVIAKDGQEAWTLLSEKDKRISNISLIISDIMMPRMDGHTLLKHIKAHEQWQQIPIIMLTAKANEESRLKALRMGVDDYLLKPFSPEELMVRIDNLIDKYEQRQVLKQLGLNIDFETTPSANQEWLQEMEKNCLNALDKKISLNYHYLSSVMHISERQMLRRLKSLTGMSIKQYIQEVKLQKAKHLLENNTYTTISEVAYACGFNSPGYFSTLFYKHFGKRPTAFFVK